MSAPPVAAPPVEPSPRSGPRWLPRLSAAAWIGWGGVALGLFAFWLALPPLLVRNVVPSAASALIGIMLGVIALRGGERRVGWGAMVACVAGLAGAAAATA